MARSVAVILANDPGSGFAGPKYLTDVGGVALIDRILADASTWPVEEVVVVLGPDAEAVVEAMAPTDATVVIDPEWQEGLAASLRVGLDVVMRGPAADFVVVAYGDQLGMSAEDIGELVDEAASAAATVPKYRYRRGLPIVLTPEVWERLLGLEGDVDLLDLLGSHPDGVVEVWFDHLAGQRIASPADIRER